MSLESIKLIFLSFMTTIGLVLTAIFALNQKNESEAEPAPKAVKPVEKNTIPEAPKPRQSYAS